MTMIQVSASLILIIIPNIIAMVFFGVDKLKSKQRRSRIPEFNLLLTALIGPFGAYAGMLFFNHKTRKKKFILVPIFIIIHIYLIIHFKTIF